MALIPVARLYANPRRSRDPLCRQTRVPFAGEHSEERSWRMLLQKRISKGRLPAPCVSLKGWSRTTCIGARNHPRRTSERCVEDRFRKQRLGLDPLRRCGQRVLICGDATAACRCSLSLAVAWDDANATTGVPPSPLCSPISFPRTATETLLPLLRRGTGTTLTRVGLRRGVVKRSFTSSLGKHIRDAPTTRYWPGPLVVFLLLMLLPQSVLGCVSTTIPSPYGIRVRVCVIKARPAAIRCLTARARNRPEASVLLFVLLSG